MKEKKVIKISLSTFFLMLSLIIIITMGIYIYIDKTNSNNKISKLESNTNNMQETINSLQNKITNNLNTSNEYTEENETNKTPIATSSTKKTYTLSDIIGSYTVPAESVTGEMSEYRLTLYENGTFFYNTNPGFESGNQGYYTIDNDNINLYVLLECGNDIGASISNKKITLLINEDNTLTDNSETKTTLKKANIQYNSPDHTSNLTDAIAIRLKNNALYYDN